MMLILAIAAIGSYFHFEPFIDCTDDGDVLLWYNSGGRKDKHRNFKFLFRYK